MVKDFLGQEIYIGDEVIYVNRKYGPTLNIGEIDKIINDKHVRVKLTNYDASKSIIKINKSKSNTLNKNPSLQFEDLKPGMWIWDDVKKRYVKIYDISYSEETFNINGDWPLNDLYLEEFKFEEGRFYKKEVY